MKTNKRIVSFLLTAVMLLTGVCVPFTAEEVSAGNTYSEMRLTDAAGEYLYYDLVFHDRAELGVSSVGFEIDYPDFLTLVSCEQEFSKGSFVTSETEDIKPYLVMWVWGTKELPFEEVIIAKLVFRVSPDVNMDDELDIDLSYSEDNEPADIKGNEHKENVEIVQTPSEPIEDIVESFPEFQPKSAFILEAVVERGRVIGLGLYIDPSEAVNAKAVSLETACPDGIKFKTARCDNGEYGFVRTGDTLSWILQSGAFPSDKTLLAELAFEITDETVAVNPFDIGLELKLVRDTENEDVSSDFVVYGYTFDPAAVVRSVNVTELPEKVKHHLADDSFEFIGGAFGFIYWNGDNSGQMSMADCVVVDQMWVEIGFHIEYFLTVEYEGHRFELANPYVYSPGDVNNDEAINLSDITDMLKHIAKWDVSINEDAADANADDGINLSDVTLLLQYIAKWNVDLK